MQAKKYLDSCHGMEKVLSKADVPVDYSNAIVPQVIVTNLKNMTEENLIAATEEIFGPIVRIFLYNDQNYGETNNIIQIVNNFNMKLKTQYNIIFSAKPLTDAYLASQLSADYILFNSFNLINSVKLIGIIIFIDSVTVIYFMYTSRRFCSFLSYR